MSQSATYRDPHRKPAIACAGLICVVIALAAIGRHAPSQATIDPKDVVSAVELKFVDQSDGAVVAIDASNGSTLERIAPGVGGFVRVTMRSFANERKQRGLGSDTPFDLARMTDGDLVLRDPLTGRRMLLNAFGPSNEGAFAQLLDQGRTIR